MSDTTDPTAGERAKCWRSECRTACYYPDVCSEVRATPDTTDPTAEEFPMVVTEAKLHTMSNTGDVEALAKALYEQIEWGGCEGASWDRAGSGIRAHWTQAAERLLASHWLAELIAAAERRGANQRAQKIAAAMETESHNHRPDRPIWLHAARIARNTR